MQMTTDHLLANPCDDEEDNMAMLCCHTNGGESMSKTAKRRLRRNKVSC